MGNCSGAVVWASNEKEQMLGEIQENAEGLQTPI